MENNTEMNPLHWCWIAPFAFLLSPFGTVIFTILFQLDLIQCCGLILVQFLIVCYAGIKSNFGE